MAPPGSCRSTSRRNTPASTTARCARRRRRPPRPPVGRKPHSVFRCTECGAEQPKWAGRCEACGAWNTLGEELVGRKAGRSDGWKGGSGDAAPVQLSNLPTGGVTRWQTGLPEFDFVLGGGLVPSSVVLVGGEPGIGKSTLLLQCAARLERAGLATLYVSGEESPEQLRLRADRLADDPGQVHVLGETRLEAILHHAQALACRVVFVDSIQTTYTDELEGAPGYVGQVRECAARLMRFAKQAGRAVLLVGHVTRGGGIAGPKTLEHIVDTVLYFEGEHTLDHRVLRAVKNRFGSVDEIGVFEMTGGGLLPVADPAAAFLAGRVTNTSGSAVTALMEGTRPLLVEIQALAAKAGFGTPQRVATGLDHRRLAVLLAVLERRGGVACGELDVFVNVTGGIRLVEPSTDLAVLAALVSSVRDRPLPADALFLGEVGLGGEVRPVAGVERRLGGVAPPGGPVQAPPDGLARRGGGGRGLGPGGDTRARSVRGGLRALPPHATVVLVHAAARPFVSRETIDGVIARAREGVGAVAAVPVSDTVKEVVENRQIVRTVPRERLWRTHTPQGFPRAMLEQAYARLGGNEAPTDDAEVCERAGAPLEVVPDTPQNFKVTTADDFRIAEALALELR